MKENKKKASKVTNANNRANDPVEIDFDGTWKAIITAFFEDFMAFFLPDLHHLIDYQRGVTFLEQELQHLVELFSYKKKVSDKLVKVFLKNGTERWKKFGDCLFSFIKLCSCLIICNRVLIILFTQKLIKSWQRHPLFHLISLMSTLR
ncbi:MAG: hypothetical protein RLZZ628_2224 [Bacteroidota bacterium]|jgi:hypothetical protein